MAKYVFSKEQCAARSAIWKDPAYRQRQANSRRQSALKRVPSRFWALVDKSGDCWLWAGRRDACGYGRTSFPGRRVERSHRLAWFLTYGEWPPLLRHKCDNPPCCNPAHLEVGTHADNAADKVMRNRAGQKLNAEKVQAIRSLRGKMTHAKIAERFGLYENTVWKILARKTWSHLPEPETVAA